MSSNSQIEGKFLGFDYIHFWVGNAKQAADWYCVRFGFKRRAYKGLETNSREVVSHVVSQGKINLIFSSALKPGNQEMGLHHQLHGDGVKDVAFSVSNCKAIYEHAVSQGAISVLEPTTTSDEHGSITIASVKTYGDTVHSLVERTNYSNGFLPGFVTVTKEDPLSNVTEPVGLELVDHVVGNQNWNEMTTVADWYKDKFGFHQFWSVDDKQIYTEYSALRSIVVTDADEVVKMPINEPAKAKKKSQIEEYVDFYGGAGVQHIALSTNDIIATVSRMRSRGVEFLTIPKAYYTNLKKRLSESASGAMVKIQEDLNMLEQLHILVDLDDKGYLLQIFTKPVEDRPTLFFEVIQRHNNNGFGAGNFKSLFEAIELEQAKRGNLV